MVQVRRPGEKDGENAQSGGTPTDLYYSSNWQVLEEQQSGSTKQTYVYSPVYVDAIVARDSVGSSSTQGGGLDTGFSSDGKQTINEAGLSEEGKDVAIDPSTGKVVVVGITSGNLKVARLNTDGAMDSGFGGTDGLAETSFAGGSVALSVVIDSSSKIYASGAGNSNFATARFTSTGGVDTSWGGTGGVETDFGGSNEQARDSVLDSSGKLIVAGESGGNFAIARLSGSNGALDTGFDTDGKLTTDFGSSSDAAYGVALQSDGKVVVVGVTGNDFAIARYTTSGALDTTFDSDGKKTIDVGSSTTDAARSVAIDSNGKILIGGDSGGNFVLVRLNADGTFDSSFNYSGTSGISVAADFGSTGAVKDIALQSDGKIVAVGSSNGNFALARFNTNGSLDENFDTDGKLTTDFGGTDTANGVAIVPAGLTDAGKIVAAGTTGADYAVARYLPGTSGTSTTRLYVTQDANFNVTGLVGTDGAVKQRFIYDPYGAKTVLNASWGAATDAYAFVQGHQDSRQDNTTGLYLFNVGGLGRSYSSSLGRWMQQDYLLYPDGLNLYAYLKSSPSSFLDASGMVPTNREKMTPKELKQILKRYRLEREAKGESCRQMINGLELYMTNNDEYNLYGKRYVYTKDGKWIDMLHFFALAGYSQDYGLIPAWIAGWGNELGQQLRFDESGAPLGNNEDMYSNNLGIGFGADRRCCAKLLEDAVMDYLSKNTAGLTTPPVLPPGVPTGSTSSPRPGPKRQGPGIRSN